MVSETIKQNLIGAIIGGLVVWAFPKILAISVHIMFVPTDILGYIGKGLSVIIGAFLGGIIQHIYRQIQMRRLR